MITHNLKYQIMRMSLWEKLVGDIWPSAVSRCGSRAGKVLPAQRGLQNELNSPGANINVIFTNGILRMN